jgi:hypothetical protein
MEALSHANCATVENLDGINSHNREGNEVKWGDDDWQLVTVGRRERPHQSCPLPKVRLLGNFLPSAHRAMCAPLVLRRAL